MGKDIATHIVRGIIKDIHSRMGLEQYFRGLAPEIQVEMYEKWIEIVSQRLHEEDLLEQAYELIDLEEMSTGEIVNRSIYYLED